ncbi:MAG: thioredoxin domain-containing protein [Desulfobacteraceae bacterium]|nr:thioredoxin domain-containing protein [Desulfobacteraceae bacterium]
MLIQHSDKIKPFGLSFYCSFLVILSFCGMLVSGYLSTSHYRIYTDLDYSSFCAISQAINCDTVSQSPYSIFWGLPVPIWGVLGYILMLVSIFISFDIKKKKINNLPFLFFLGTVFSSISIFLAILSAVEIHSYCIMCIITYGINFMLLYTIWLIKRRFEKESWKTAIINNIKFYQYNKYKIFKFYSPLIVFTIMIMIFIPDYWNLTYTNHGTKTLKTGITMDGSPWIGAKNPELTITEYTDYMCFQCKKMHFFLKNLVALHPDKIKLIHKHFPMDQKFNPTIKENLHPGSGTLALIAIYAAKKNKFWEVNDFLYHYDMSKGAIYLRQIAQESNLDLAALQTGIRDPKIKQKLEKDILSGLKKGISGTPSYIINNKVYAGQIPPDILNLIRK